MKDDIFRQQREAEERVRRMQERARRLLREQPVNLYRGAELTAAAVPFDPPKRTPPAARPAVRHPDGEERDERLFLLLLAALLSQSDASLQLIALLLYIAG